MVSVEEPPTATRTKGRILIVDDELVVRDSLGKWFARYRAHRSRIRQRDGGALKIGRREFALAGARHQVVEGRQILLEIECAGVLDAGNQEVPASILARDIDGDPQVDLRLHHAVGLSILFYEGVIQPQINLGIA